MDYKQAREDKGLTIQQVSALAGYAIGTISDLENRGLGSDRLKDKLAEIYNTEIDETALREDATAAKTGEEYWKGRAHRAEKALADLQDGMRKLLGTSLEPPSAEEALAIGEGERIDRAHRKR